MIVGFAISVFLAVWLSATPGRYTPLTAALLALAIVAALIFGLVGMGVI